MKGKLILFAALLLPFLHATIWLTFGNLMFWYDPARDLLLAWDNLSKPTLIGPPSGIPGIFYGPYWIWLLSFGELFSKNPLVVTFVTATIPYCIIFPLIWFQFAKFFDRTTLLIGWILFITGTGFIYLSRLWNPYPAPLFTLAIMYLLIRFHPDTLSWQAVLISGLLGFLLGLMTTFHISFGIALSFGILLFLLGNLIVPILRKKREFRRFQTRLLLLLATGAGFFIAFLPILLFEARHGFTQLQTLVATFTKYGAVVGTEGLDKQLILNEFFATFGSLLHIPTNMVIPLLVILFIFCLVMVRRNKVTFTSDDKRIMIIVSTIITAVALIYFTARNPVWAYHFIGVEIPMLIGICLLITKFPLIKKGAIILLIVVIAITGVEWYKHISQHDTSVIQKQKEVVETIVKDAQNANYTVFTYSPSIYNYDYPYFFKWIAGKEISYDPGQNPQDTDIVYLITPVKHDSEVTDFINYRGNQKEYTIAQSWTLYNDVQIIKKTKKN